MTINHKNESLAIHTIIEAYKSLDNHGFRLHIEDKAPEGLTFAGQVPQEESTSRRIVSEEEVERVLARRRARTAAAAKESTIAGICTPVEVIDPSYDGEVYDAVYFFIHPLLSFAMDEENLKQLAKQYVAHELRHAQQFVWLRDHGINPLDALRAENGSVYGQGPLERDAYCIQYGGNTPIDKAMACFIK